MTRPLLLALCLACSTTVMAASTMTAAHAEDGNERAAKKYYERGQKLFNLRKFSAALEQFQKAFDAKPLPTILFNIGQTHRNLGDNEAAIFSFKRYLKLLPGADNREQVEELIATLEEEVDREKTRQLRLEPPPRVSEPPAEDTERLPGRAATPPGSRSVYKKWWFWTGVAVVGVAGGVGIWAATRSDGAGAPPTTFPVMDPP